MTNAPALAQHATTARGVRIQNDSLNIYVERQRWLENYNKLYVYAIITVVALGGILFGFDMVIISGKFYY